jgi:hypothetical protein
MNYNIGPRILEAKEGFHRYAKIMQELEREAKKHPPVEAAKMLTLQALKHRSIAHLELRCSFGVDFYRYEPHVRVVHPTLVPKELYEFLSSFYGDSDGTAVFSDEHSAYPAFDGWGLIKASVSVIYLDDLCWNLERALSEEDPLLAVLEADREITTRWAVSVAGGFCTVQEMPDAISLLRWFSASAMSVSSTSCGSSSTSRISPGSIIDSPLDQRERKMKGRADTYAAFRPSATSVTVNNAPHIRKSYAGPLELLRTVQTLKHPEEFVYILHVEAHTVVPYEENDLISFDLAADFDHGLLAGARVLDGIG